jgi:hypothetical protein
MIEIEISEEILNKAEEYAEKQQLKIPSEKPQEQFLRLKIEKIGEEIGKEALKILKIPYDYINDTIVIFPNTLKQKTIEFKTLWELYHTRIQIPKDVFISKPRDIYIGIKLRLEINKAYIYGYITYEELAKLHPIKDFGEGPVYWAYLYELHPLEELIK